MTATMELAGLADAARDLGVSLHTMIRWARDDPDFPKPVADLQMGRVYLLPEIRNWRRGQIIERRRRRAF